MGAALSTPFRDSKQHQCTANPDSYQLMDGTSKNISSSSLDGASLDSEKAKSQPINVNQPEMRRQLSAEHNAHMRQVIAPWGSLSSTPEGCRAVSYSSWRRFSATSSNRPRPSNEMTAAALLEANGLTAEFDPPVLERCDLSINEDIVGNPTAELPGFRYINQQYRNRRYNQRLRSKQFSRTSSTSSWSTLTSEDSSRSAASDSVLFQKQRVRPARTSSLLTMSFKGTPEEKSTEPSQAVLARIGKEFGIERLSINDLPEDAFESDSEDED